MGNAIFPTLPGLSWSSIKAPTFSTRVQKSVSGKELRAAYYSTPIWKFSLTYEFLRANATQELQQLVGFFNARQGSFDSFLYLDPTDNVVSQQVFAVGDGVTTRFKLSRNLGGFSEPVAALQLLASIQVNGADFPWANNANWVPGMNDGTVTFAVPPAAGASLSWSGNYYFRVRFTWDSTEFENFMKDLWAAKKVELVSVK